MKASKQLTLKVKKMIGSLCVYIAFFLFISVILDIIRQPKISKTVVAKTYESINHKKVSFINSTPNNKATIVYFWGTWCGVCSVVSPKINQLHKDGYPVITVALSSGTDTEIKQYLQKKQYQFDVINDNDANISNSWDINAVPVIAIIKNGKLVYAMTGFHAEFDIKMRYAMVNF